MPHVKLTLLLNDQMKDHSHTPNPLYRTIELTGINVLSFRSHFYELMRDLEKPERHTKDKLRAQVELCLYYLRAILAGLECLLTQLKEM